MSRKSRDKGKRGELEAARLLSAWWMGRPELRNSKAEELPIRRTPLSGGWATAKGVQGDLVAVHDDAKDFSLLSVEVKNQEVWDFDGMIKNRAWPVYAYWKQCKAAAKRANALPFLVFTKNKHPFYFCLSQVAYADLKAAVVIDSGIKTGPSVLRWKGLVIGLLEDLTSNYTKKHFKLAFGDFYGA
jgi:hypothetical protein